MMWKWFPRRKSSALSPKTRLLNRGAQQTKAVIAVVALALLIALTPAAVAVERLPTLLQQSRDGDCAEWRACRQLALAAAERGEFEKFHDLAWRAVQTGPPKDPALMYLLARAQALSGRPHDALIMLQRLADMGVAPDATGDEFSRTRQLPGWPDVEAHIAAVVAAGSLPSASSPVPAVSVIRLAPATHAVRFLVKPFAVSGLVYDAASRRFVLGDRLGRKLIAVDERLNHTVDLVRAESAGFLDVSAIEIDTKRGDLWVASGGAPDGTGALHKLQLISGRPLRTFPIAADSGPVKLVDVAVDSAGAVLVLDSMTSQLLMLRPGRTALERVVRIDAQEPVSVTAGGEDGVAFVAHRDGLSRIDLRSRIVSPVAAPNGVALGHLERIRWRSNALIAVRVDDDGSARRILRLEMNAKGSAITQVSQLALPAPVGRQDFMTISRDEVVYLMADSNEAGGRPSNALSDERAFVAYLVPLR
jgi:hypothetical protein